MVTTTNKTPVFSLEDYLQNPPEHTEWVDGQLVEKNGMTAKHSRTQARLSYYWRSYMISNNIGGEVYTEASCRTAQQGRRPDVAYLPPELVNQFGDFNVLPQSFPLIAEIVSPTDCAEDIFAKATEYLASGCEEVWLVLPESHWIAVITRSQRCLYTTGDIAKTENLLPGFAIAVDELLS